VSDSHSESEICFSDPESENIPSENLTSIRVVGSHGLIPLNVQGGSIDSTAPEKFQSGDATPCSAYGGAVGEATPPAKDTTSDSAKGSDSPVPGAELTFSTESDNESETDPISPTIPIKMISATEVPMIVDRAEDFSGGQLTLEDDGEEKEEETLEFPQIQAPPDPAGLQMVPTTGWTLTAFNAFAPPPPSADTQVLMEALLFCHRQIRELGLGQIQQRDLLQQWFGKLVGMAGWMQNVAAQQERLVQSVCRLQGSVNDQLLEMVKVTDAKANEAFDLAQRVAEATMEHSRLKR